MHADETELNRFSERIIGCAFSVSNTLGADFLEKIYENALGHEPRKAGLMVARQCGIIVRYGDVVVGEYAVDLLVEDSVFVEFKAAKAIDDIHHAQCLNYLKASGLRMCLQINFGRPRLDIKRSVLSL
jgi:GxxExxY protein